MLVACLASARWPRPWPSLLVAPWLPRTPASSAAAPREANQGSKVAGSKARLPCTDMPATCRPQRAVSGARGGRSAAAHAIVFGAPQTTMVRLMYSDKEGDTIRLASRRRQRGGSGAAAPISSFRRTARTARTARRAHRRIEVASPTAPRKAFLRPKDGGSGNTSVCNEDPR